MALEQVRHTHTHYSDSRDSGGGWLVAVLLLMDRRGKATTPAPARLVVMEATGVQALVLGQYISAVLRYAFPSWPPTAKR